MYILVINLQSIPRGVTGLTFDGSPETGFFVTKIKPGSHAELSGAIVVCSLWSSSSGGGGIVVCPLTLNYCPLTLILLLSGGIGVCPFCLTPTIMPLSFYI